ncbi:hypothetical protein EON76_02265 [bacterium]|nr:MAG: hypothetical protein EON76_02265 [bacterium]
MIEINLIPDVKQELIVAKRIQAYVISGSIVAGIAVLAVVAIMGFYLVAVQGILSSQVDSSIDTEGAKLSKVDDLSNMLTIQHQLSSLSEMHDGKSINSRVFDILTAINPPQPNQISISSAKVDTDSKTITIDGQAANMYDAAEVFKKTVLGTSISYTNSDNNIQTIPLTESVSTTDISFGEDATGKKVLRFTMSFIYDDAVFARSSRNLIIARPDSKNVTDSFLRIPQSLFSTRASNIGGGQ